MPNESTIMNGSTTAESDMGPQTSYETPEQNETNVYDFDGHNTGWVLFQIAFYLCVIVFGILGNILIIRVYATVRRGTNKITTTAVLVMALALSDLTVCVFRFRNIAILHALLSQRPVFLAVVYLEIPDKVLIATTVLLTGTIAFDRFDCVCRPYSRMFNVKSTMVAAVGCLIVSVVANAPLVVQLLNPFIQPMAIALMIPVFQVVAFLASFVTIVVCYSKVYYRIRQHTRVVVGESDGRHREPAQPNMIPALTNVVPLVSHLTTAYTIGGTTMTNLPSAVPSTSTARPCPTTINPAQTHSSLNIPSVSRHLPSPVPTNTNRCAPGGEMVGSHTADNRSSRQHLHQNTRPKSLQRKTTRMLFITSVVFILTWLPQGVYVGTQFLGRASRGGTVVNSDAIFNLKPVLFMNNVVNPIIYGLANRRFRKDCIDVLRKLKPC